MSVSGAKRVVVRYDAAVTTVEVINVAACVPGIIVSAAEEIGGIDNFEPSISDSYSSRGFVLINKLEAEDGDLILELNGTEVAGFIGEKGEEFNNNEDVEFTMPKFDDAELLELEGIKDAEPWLRLLQLNSIEEADPDDTEEPLLRVLQ